MFKEVLELFFSKLKELEEKQELIKYRNPSFRAKQYKILVAVSGGLDSVVLLDTLSRFSTPNINISGVLHVDHGLREVSSDDASFVASIAKKLDIPFFLYKATPPSNNSNIENWGREVRYDFFSSKLKELGADFVATAHHEDDLVETFLFRLINGRVNSFLIPIKEIDLERKLIRPLLKISRKQIDDYALQNNIIHVEDESNSDLKYRRNFIRHSIVPLCREMNPSFSSAILSYLYHNNEQQLFLKDYCQRELDKEKLNKCSYLESLPNILAVEALRMICRENFSNIEPLIARGQFEFLVNELNKRPNITKSFDVGFGLSAIIEVADDKERVVKFSLR